MRTTLNSLYQEFDKITGYHFADSWLRKCGLGFDVVGLGKILDSKIPWFNADGVSLANALETVHGKRAKEVAGEILDRERRGEK